MSTTRIIPTNRTVYRETVIHIIECASCAIDFGIGADFVRRRREDHQTFYCPNGHSNVYNGPTKAEREAKAAKERAERLATALRASQDQQEAAQRDAAEARASEVRIRWRVGNGVCPCCQRTFAPLAAHVATKHPEFVHHDLDALSERMRLTLAAIHHTIEDQEVPVVDAYDVGLNMNSVRALVNRGLVEQVEYHRVALTEAGWPLAQSAATQDGAA